MHKKHEEICRHCSFWAENVDLKLPPQYDKCRLHEFNFWEWYDKGKKDVSLTCPFELEHVLNDSFEGTL